MATLEQHAAQLAALGHPVRLSILRYVVQAGHEGSAAGDIQQHVRLPASTVSHHLKRLQEAGVLTSRTEGTFHYYTAHYTALQALTQYLWEDCCKAGASTACAPRRPSGGSRCC